MDSCRLGFSDKPNRDPGEAPGGRGASVSSSGNPPSLETPALLGGRNGEAGVSSDHGGFPLLEETEAPVAPGAEFNFRPSVLSKENSIEKSKSIA